MATPRKTLFLVDAMGYIFRAYYAPMDRLMSPAGIPTKVPYVFANMVRRLLKLKEPRADYFGVVFDAPGRTFRDDLFAAYKAQRPPMPDDLGIQLPFVRRVCAAMRLPILEYSGYEADDVIGGFARQGIEQGLDVVVITSDKDMMQLVTSGTGLQPVTSAPAQGQLALGGAPAAPGPSDADAAAGSVRVLIPTKGDLIVDAAKVEELMGVPPDKVPDVMALMGDSIDNIPGAKGIGEKGARELILQYGSAEAALEHAEEVKGKRYREALLNCREQVLMSKKLATIATDVPLRLELETLRIQEPDAAALRQLYAELGFTSMVREIPAAAVPASPAADRDYARLETSAALRDFLTSIPKGKSVAAWLSVAPEEEEPGYGSRAVALELSLAPGMARVAWLDDKGEMLAALREWLATGVPLIVHDPKLLFMLLDVGADLRVRPVAELQIGPDANKPETGRSEDRPLQTDAAVAGAHTGAPLQIRDAVALYSYLLRPITAKHDLPEVALRQLNAPPTGEPGESADLLQQLAPPLRAEVEQRGLLELYEKVDLPLAPVLARMERAGVRVDPEALGAMSAAMDEELRGMERRIYEHAGGEFNINSPQQLAEILFDKLQLPMPRKYGRGKVRSTAADVLEDLAALHELPRAIIEYREIAKLKSTYVDALPRLIHPQTGRLHTRLSQTGTATGRLSSSNPNLQNIPVRSELGRKIRAAFAASPGSVLLSADYSQIELRILAHFSGDPVLVEAFQKGEDIHARTAQEVFGVGPLMQTPEHRRVAKVINFGIIYGLSAFGLAQQLGISQSEAQKFISAYFERYRGVKQYLDAQVEEVKRTGISRTLLGRARPIPEIHSKQVNIRNFAIRTALNTPFQGTAADLIKLAMIEIDERLAHVGFRAQLILQVHDELLFECPPEELDALRNLVKPAMEQVQKLKVPVVVDLKSGPNWRDMK
jgi:DNA polymerase-1